jgi:hypothetical protein
MRVPVYERGLSPEVSRPVALPEGAAGGFEAKAMQQAGRMLGDVADEGVRIALDMRQKADDAAVLEAANSWDELTTKYLNDPDSGLFNRKGKGAKGMSGEATEWFGKLESDLMKGLENENQRSLFSKYILRNRSSKVDSIARHERAEFQNYRVEVTNQAVTNAVNTIAANYADDGIFEAQLDTAENALLTLLADQGEEVVTAKVKALHSAAHEARLAQWLEANPKAAEAYFKKYKDGIDGTNHAKWAKAIDTQTAVIWTQEEADKLVKRFGSETAALRYIREHYEGDRENSLVTAVKTRYSERRTAQAEATRVRNERIADTVEGAASATELDATLAKMGVPEAKRRTLVNNWMRWNAQDFGVRADFAKDEEEILALGERYGVPPVTVRRAINEHRAVFEGEAEDLALATASEEEFLATMKEKGATDAQLARAQSVFRKVHKPTYDEAEKQAALAEEWAIRDAIDRGEITTREQLMSAAGRQSKDKINELKKYLEDNKDPAQSYVNSEVKRRYKEAKLREEELPLFMSAFLTRTRNLGPDKTEEKLKIADELMKKETAKKGMFNWIFGTTWKIPAHLVPKGYTYSPKLDAFTNGTDKWNPPEKYLYR